MLTLYFPSFPSGLAHRDTFHSGSNRTGTRPSASGARYQWQGDGILYNTYNAYQAQQTGAQHGATTGQQVLPLESYLTPTNSSRTPIGPQYVPAPAAVQAPAAGAHPSSAGNAQDDAQQQAVWAQWYGWYAQAHEEATASASAPAPAPIPSPYAQQPPSAYGTYGQSATGALSSGSYGHGAPSLMGLAAGHGPSWNYPAAGHHVASGLVGGQTYGQGSSGVAAAGQPFDYGGQGRNPLGASVPPHQGYSATGHRGDSRGGRGGYRGRSSRGGSRGARASGDDRGASGAGRGGSSGHPAGPAESSSGGRGDSSGGVADGVAPGDGGGRGGEEEPRDGEKGSGKVKKTGSLWDIPGLPRPGFGGLPAKPPPGRRGPNCGFLNIRSLLTEHRPYVPRAIKKGDTKGKGKGKSTVGDGSRARARARAQLAAAAAAESPDEGDIKKNEGVEEEERMEGVVEALVAPTPSTPVDTTPAGSRPPPPQDVAAPVAAPVAPTTPILPGVAASVEGAAGLVDQQLEMWEAQASPMLSLFGEVPGREGEEEDVEEEDVEEEGGEVGAGLGSPASSYSCGQVRE
ncbi:hypothetical protein N3K66_000317 [Trichothecium roseum]|uniref:Uncharacterized protein n=1 Tax=Trichothecium roseum TaxID=47278 RepID=A0ACC0VE98_9HYPO|nr:hypothetical protein N3K66_000317 [Trichothecium roseum]